MASRIQQARRRAIYRGAAITMSGMTAWLILLGLAETITR